MKSKYTPERIESLNENEIFVFGSTLKGVHKGGAAKLAVEKFGAVMGQGIGLQGKSYAIPTMQKEVARIIPYVAKFLEFAQENPNKLFLVTKVGCGRAGHKVSDIAPLFINAYKIDNILLPKEFCEIIEKLLPVETFCQEEISELSIINEQNTHELKEQKIEDIIVSSKKEQFDNIITQVEEEEVFEVEKPKIEINVVGKIDLTKYEKKRKEIKTDCKNIYIIDTNVFVECPNIISKINNKFGVVLSAKVIDELDKLKIKLDNDGRLNVQKALRMINTTIGKRDIKMEYADPSLLPEDFDKKSPDNLILSVALKFKNDNPILLTSDNGLQIKAKMMGITTISLKDFL